MFKKIITAINNRFGQPRRINTAALVAREAQRTRLLTGYAHESDDEIILRALKQYNFVTAFGLNPGDLEELCKYFAQKGLPK